MITNAMQAIVAARPGGPEVLEILARPVPVPGPGQVLIAVEAAGVNRPDLMQRAGVMIPPPGVTDILGLEAAGTIVGLGEGAAPWSRGDRVMALLAGGGYAQYCLARADHCLAVPESLDMTAAGALPEALFTVWHNVFELGRLKMGETLLVHGGASGIGSIAIQMAKAAGARVLVTVGSPEKAEAAAALGADAVIDHRTEDFVSRCHRETKGAGVDLVLDIVGGDYVARNLETLAPGGRHVSLSFPAGAQVLVDLSVVMRKSLTLTSSTLRPKPDHEKARLARAVAAHVLPLVESGAIVAKIHARLPLGDAARAHAMLEAGENIGKVVLAPDRQHEE